MRSFYLESIHKLSVFQVFEIENSNSRRVKNLNRRILMYLNLDFEQQRRSWTL